MSLRWPAPEPLRGPELLLLTQNVSSCSSIQIWFSGRSWKSAAADRFRFVSSTLFREFNHQCRWGRELRSSVGNEHAHCQRRMTQQLHLILRFRCECPFAELRPSVHLRTLLCVAEHSVQRKRASRMRLIFRTGFFICPPATGMTFQNPHRLTKNREKDGLQT